MAKTTPTLAADHTWYKGATMKSTITAINIMDSYIPTGSETESWDASAENNGSVMCYITGTVLTIAGNGSGKIYANEGSANAFYAFTTVVKITGLNLLDTSNVTNMFSMFNNCSSLTSLDLSSWDTSNVTRMAGMFAYCEHLTSLNVSNLDTSHVTNMGSMFYNCSSLTSLDLSR